MKRKGKGRNKRREEGRNKRKNGKDGEERRERKF